MAINPMQRRTRNSFLVGILIGLVATGISIFLFTNKVKKLNAEITELKSKTQKVCVLMEDAQSGDIITADKLMDADVQTTLAADQIVDMAYLASEVDEDGNEIGEYMLKINVPAGTIITKDMLQSVDDVFDDSQRLQEYNMIVLPTLLKNGDYVDIRLQLPTGVDYVVLSKKRIESCTSDTIWMNMSEAERLVLGNAIVESYVMNGSKLYATVYTEAGRQEASTQTYVVSTNVAFLIDQNPNITTEARNALASRYNSGYEEVRNQNINPAVEQNEDYVNTVEGKLEEELSKIQAARETYVTSLDGTGMVGMVE